MSDFPFFLQDDPVHVPEDSKHRLPFGLSMVRFAPRHLLAMTIRAEAREMFGWCGGVVTVAPSLAARGPGVTLLVHGHVAACAGVSLFWPGVGEAWCAPSPWVDAHPLAFARAARIGFDELARASNLHRMQAHVAAKHHKSIRWIKWLGFEAEGMCPGYGPKKETTIRYRRLFTCKQ